jgi:hypothetical protein
MKRTVYLMVIWLVVSSDVLAQSEYLHKGESGLGLSAGIANSQSKTASENSTGFSIGYSINTIVDLDFGYAQTSPSEVSVTQAGISYDMSHQTTKDNATTAISLLFQSFSGNACFGFGFGIDRNITYNNPLLFHLFVDLSCYPAAMQSTGKKTVFIFSVGSSIGWHNDDKYSIAIVPHVGYQKNIFSLGASAVIVINTN